MRRPVTIIGAPSSIGIRPYDDGEERHLNRTPAVLRERGLAARLNADDLGDLVPPAYRDYARPPGRARNEDEVLLYSRALANRVSSVATRGQFALVLGGECSIVLGCVLGARRATGAAVGLVYLDAHADFATPDESRTGSVASMALGFALGRGNSPLARLAGRAPLVDGRHVALIGRRDAHDAWYSHAALAASSVLDVPDTELTTRDLTDLAAASLDRVTAPGTAGFWIQLDVEVLNPAVMFAVDSPEPGGLMPGELVELLAPMVRHPRALGLSLTIYDPALDPDRSCARALVDVLESLFTSRRSGSGNVARHSAPGLPVDRIA